MGLSFFTQFWWPRESMLWGSRMLSEFHTLLSKVRTLWHDVKVKQCYLGFNVRAVRPKMPFSFSANQPLCVRIYSNISSVLKQQNFRQSVLCYVRRSSTEHDHSIWHEIKNTPQSCQTWRNKTNCPSAWRLNRLISSVHLCANECCKWESIQARVPPPLCLIFTILVSFSQDNALFASRAKINVFWKAKINVFWNFFEWSGPKRPAEWRKIFKKRWL